MSVREPFIEIVRADSFSTVAMHNSFDHSVSIASLILVGSSFSEDEVGLEGDSTGRLKTLPGEVGGLPGGEATADAYDLAIWLTRDVWESKGLSDSC